MRRDLALYFTLTLLHIFHLLVISTTKQAGVVIDTRPHQLTRKRIKQPLAVLERPAQAIQRVGFRVARKQRGHRVGRPVRAQSRYGGRLAAHPQERVGLIHVIAKDMLTHLPDLLQTTYLTYNARLCACAARCSTCCRYTTC